MTGTVFLRSLKKLSLLQDFGSSIFEEKMKTYRNRLPLGGIKTPFNLENSLDYYSSRSEEVFHCYCITKGVQKVSDIFDIVRANFGEMSESVVYGDTLEFFFNLLAEEQMKELGEKLDT